MNECEIACGSLFDAYYYHPEYNISKSIDPYRDTWVKGLNWGYTNFDNIFWALLTIF